MTLVFRPLPNRPPVQEDLFQENATLAARRDVSERVASFRIRLDTARPAFLPGQYVSLGLKDGNQIIQRPYSMASSPAERQELEFCIQRVADGAFTSRLWLARPGTRLRVGPPRGRFVLDREDPRDRLFIASGTGVAPFLSMLAERRESSGSRTLVLHGVSYVSELAISERLDAWQLAGYPLEYIPSVSRSTRGWSPLWRGHIGRVETLLSDICAQRTVNPRSTVGYLCGNAGMVRACLEILGTRGFGPQDLRLESYQGAGRPCVAQDQLADVVALGGR